MVLHTIISEYDIFRNQDDIYQPQYMNISDGFIEYNECKGEKKIVRLHSTNPYDYLKDEYSPDTLIN